MNQIEQDFIDKINTEYSGDINRFIEREIFHGSTALGKEAKIEYDFKEAIAKYLSVNISNVHIVGSAKLGYSVWKGTPFSYNSDIDVAITDERCFHEYLKYIEDLDYYLLENGDFYSENDHKRYYNFLRYVARGWFRPDKIPKLMPINDTLQDSWFNFFRSISGENCLLGNYEVKCGLYRNKETLTRYQLDGLNKKYISLTSN